MPADLSLAARRLAKSPGFTLVAVLTLALGMGANTTFFSVLYGVVLKALPFPASHKLVELRNLGPALGSNDGRVSLAELRDYQARQRSLADLAAYNLGRVTLALPDGAERVVRVRVTANLFSLLGVAPALGRGFEVAEENAGRDRVVVISHDFWRSHFNNASDVLQRTVRLNGLEHTIVGVMPAGFSFGDPGVAVWQPLDLASRGPADRSDHYLSTVARLAPGFSLTRAESDLARVARQLRADAPAAYPAEPQWSLDVVSLRESHFGRLRTPLGALVAAAAAVLLLACVNVSIMFLLRAAVRRREIMIRLSLGAGRRHIARQLLAESSLVCALGALGGLAFAAVGLQLLKTFPPADIPRLAEVTLNLPVAAFSVGVLALVTLLVGLAPALTILKTPAAETLTSATRATETRTAVRLRDALTLVEIALAVLLLVGGGLAFRSFHNLLRDDVGFATQHLFTFKTNLTPQAHPDLASANRFYEQLTAKLETLPGVTSVAAVSSLPLSEESQFAAAAPLAVDLPASGPALDVAWRVVRGPYFSTIGTTLLHGRFFAASDQITSPLVAVVDDAFTQRYWRHPADALGQQVRFGAGAAAHLRTIVGVIRHLKHSGPGQQSPPHVYVPHAQFYQRGMFTVVKTATPAAALAPLIRARLAEVDPTIPLYFANTMEQRYANTLALPRFTAGLIGAFAALALVLAAVGIFGVTAYSVAQRSREFGIRFAIGAPRAHVVGLVLGRVTRLALLGGALGAFAAYQLAQLMAHQLYGVEPADLPSLAASATLIAFTALLATLVPLLRALRVNPADALRAE